MHPDHLADLLVIVRGFLADADGPAAVREAAARTLAEDVRAWASGVGVGPLGLDRIHALVCHHPALRIVLRRSVAANTR
jgi:hypothetical protein